MSTPIARQPCGGNQGPALFLGGCYQHLDAKLSSIPIKRNNTMYPNYTGSGFIFVYPLPEQRDAPDCSPFNIGGNACPESADPCYVCGDGVNGNPFCGPPTLSFTQPCNAGTTSLDLGGGYFNCYYQTAETTSLSECHNIGFKNVYSFKNWQGRRSYTSRTWLQADALSWCCSCPFHAYDPVTDTTKYLSIAGAATTHLHTDLYNCNSVINGQVCCPTDAGGQLCSDNICTTCTPNGVIDITANANHTVHMDQFGNQYNDICTSGSSGCTGPDADTCTDFWAGNAMNLANSADTSVLSIVANYCFYFRSFSTAFGDPDVNDGSDTDMNKHLEWHGVLECFDECGNVISHTTVLFCALTMTADSLDVYQYGPKFPKDHCDSDGSCPSWVQTSHIHLEFSALSYLKTEHDSGIGSISFDQTFDITVNGSLATAYTQDTVKSQMKNLMGFWNLGDDNMYPVRFDDRVSTGPLVCYDEGGGTPTLGVSCTSSIIQFTGDIIGKPAPSGIDRIWNPLAKVYAICDSLVQPGCLTFYHKYWGAWSTDTFVPRATQWLNAQQASSMPQGAFIQMNQMFTIPGTCNSNGPSLISDDTVWGCKYLEVIFPKQSYDFFNEPCGINRFQISESSDRCVIQVTDKTVDIEPGGPPINFASGDYVWICGTGTVDGLWKATVNSDFQFTVHNFAISASVFTLPPVENCGTGLVYKLRWQTLQPAICGRINIDQVSFNNAPITCSLHESSYLVNNDSVTIENATGSIINGVWNVIVIDENTVALSGSSGISQSRYTGSGQMFTPPNGGYISDVQPKGDYSTMEFIWNTHDVGEYYRLANQTQSLSPDADGECDGSPCYSPAIISDPRTFQGPCGMDQRVVSASCSTHCLPFNACKGVAAYYSPNSESFGATGSVVSAFNHGFGDVTLDSQYGNWWNGLITQEMNDPLFTAPPCPCEFVPDFSVFACPFFWLEDDGTCEPDDFTVFPPNKFFAHSNVYEARCEVPSGSPALPPNVYIGCAKTTDFKSATCPTGSICPPPVIDANSIYLQGETGLAVPIVFPWATPWLTYLRELGCVCLDGRFSASYNANGVICFNNGIVNPP